MQRLSKVFNENFFKFLVALLIVFIPLYPKFPSIRIPGVYVSIRLEDFIIFFSLVFFSIYLFLNKNAFIKLIRDNTSRSIIIFLFIGFVSLISSVFLTQTVNPSLATLHWFRRVEYFSLFFMGFIYIKYINTDKKIYEFIIKLLILINFFVFLYGFGERYLKFPVIITQNEEYSKGIALWWIPGSHINSTFAGHYDLASYLVLTLPIFIGTFFLVKHKKEKIIFGLSIITGLWLLSVAVSRISIPAFVLASGITLFLLKKYKQILILILVSGLIFGFSADLRERYGRIFEVIKIKMSNIITVYAEEVVDVFEDRSTSIRLNVEWPRAIRAFYKNPLLGTGYSSISLATDNDYLRVLGEVGILGLIGFLQIFVNLFRKYLNSKFEHDYESIFKAGIIGSTVAILITAVFIDIFEASKFATIFWLFTGLVL